MSKTDARFLPGIPVDHVMTRLAAAGGKELESGKIDRPESSAALAINTFGWFIERPAILPRFPAIRGVDWPPHKVDIEYCARFPWSGGRHPWLDAVVETGDTLIGIESKRFEPFRDKKNISLSHAYDRPVWGENMRGFEAMRDALRNGAQAFVYLDATQLVKHAFGLVTDAARHHKSRCILVYLFAEPSRRGAKPIGQTAHALHREEIRRFATAVAGDAVGFVSTSYRDWLTTWPSDSKLADHRAAVLERFDP